MKTKLHIVLILTLCFVWLILLQAESWAATYYLDVDGIGQDGIAGTADDVVSDDANPGTSAEPWKTLARAYDSNTLTPNVEPGDTVYLRTGNYGMFNESDVTRTNWITYKNATGHTPVFAGISISNSTQIDTYLKFDGIKVQQPLPDPMPPDDGYNHLVGYIVHFKRTNYMDIRNCTLVGCNKYLTTALFMVDYSSHVTVYHNDMSVARGGFEISRTSNSELTYNYLHNISEGTGIRILPGDFNILVEGNHLTDGNNDENDPYYPRLAGSGWHQGTGIGIRSSNLTIRNNIVHDIRWPQGMMFYGDIGQAFHDITIENNLFYDCQEFKFYSCGTNILIRNNTFVGETVIYTTRYDEMHMVNVINRYWMPVPTLSMYSGYDGNSVELYNNIGIGYWSMPDPADPNLYYLENYNIIWSKLDGTNNTKGAHTKIVVWSLGGLRGWPNYFEDIGYRGSTPEYNYTADGIRPFFVNPGFYTGSAQGGKDKGKFWDYHLAPNSPGINFGDPNNQPSDSLGTIGPDGFIRDDGPTRDANHHSVGCYEYGSSSPSNQPPVANAGPDQTITDNDKNGSEQVTLDGSGSSDPDDTIDSYVWSEDDSHIATSVKPTVILSIGTHLITLTVTDNGGLTDTDTVTIKVLKEDKEFGKLSIYCYNNVFNPLKGEEALIWVELPKQARVKVNVYNTRGNRIKKLVDKEEEAGPCKYRWDGKDDSNNVVGSGLYFVHIQAGGYKKTKKIVVVK